MLNKKIAIIGYSGHGLVVAEAAIAKGYNLKYYIEREETRVNYFKLEYLGDEMHSTSEAWNKPDQYILGVGDNLIRKKIVDRFTKRNKEIINVFHPSISLSKHISTGMGNFFSRHVSVNIGTRIGSYCILNTGSIIEHECLIHDFVHIGPGATLAGNVEIGKGSFVGANSVVKQGVKIGENVIIGAGTVIIKNVSDNTTVVGNPGKNIKKNGE